MILSIDGRRSSEQMVEVIILAVVCFRECLSNRKYYVYYIWPDVIVKISTRRILQSCPDVTCIFRIAFMQSNVNKYATMQMLDICTTFMAGGLDVNNDCYIFKLNE